MAVWMGGAGSTVFALLAAAVAGALAAALVLWWREKPGGVSRMPDHPAGPAAATSRASTAAPAGITAANPRPVAAVERLCREHPARAAVLLRQWMRGGMRDA